MPTPDKSPIEFVHSISELLNKLLDQSKHGIETCEHCLETLPVNTSEFERNMNNANQNIISTCEKINEAFQRQIELLDDCRIVNVQADREEQLVIATKELATALQQLTCFLK